MIDIIYAALPMSVSAQIEKTTRANLYIYIGVGQGTCKKSRPFLARAYTTLVVLVFPHPAMKFKIKQEQLRSNKLWPYM